MNPSFRTHAPTLLRAAKHYAGMMAALMLSATLSPCAAQRPGSIDHDFNPDGDGANGTVQAIALQPDGKILIGGEFTSYNGVARNHVARLNADGSIDTSFDPGTGTDGRVQAIALLPDGKIIIGGIFESYNGIPCNFIARLNPNGGLDTGFSLGEPVHSPPGGWIDLSAIVARPDGKIIIGGSFDLPNSLERNIAQRNADGSPDYGAFFSFLQHQNRVTAVALQPDGKVLVGTRESSIVRYDEDFEEEHLDLGMTIPRNISGFALQRDGKVLAAGSFDDDGGWGAFWHGIVRFNTDGTQDTGFGGSGTMDGGVNTIALQPDGKVLVAGRFTNQGTDINYVIARLNADGSLDTSFDPGTGANGTIRSTALQADGKIIIGGEFTSYDGTGRNRIARLHGDGITTHVPERHPGTLAVFPNPATGHVTVRMAEGGAAHLLLRDVAGRTLLEERRNATAGQDMALSIGHLPPGTYLLELRTAGGGGHAMMMKE